MDGGRVYGVAAEVQSNQSYEQKKCPRVAGNFFSTVPILWQSDYTGMGYSDELVE